MVMILFERLETKVYAPVGDENVPDRTEIPSVGTEIPLVETIIPPDRSENPLLKELGIEERILATKRLCVNICLRFLWPPRAVVLGGLCIYIHL